MANNDEVLDGLIRETAKTGITLINLSNGEAVAEWQEYYQKVLNDLVDPNKREDVRTITQKVHFKPRPDGTAAIAIETSVKLAKKNPIFSQMMFGREDESDEGIAREIVERQTQLPYPVKPAKPAEGSGQ